MTRIGKSWMGFGIALTALALLSACQRTEEGVEMDREWPAETRERLEEGLRDLEPAVEDATITARVTSKIAADREVSVFDIEVSTEGGVVTLEGAVESEAHRAQAEALALDTSGVVRVDNRIRIELAEPEETEEPDQEDGEAAALS